MFSIQTLNLSVSMTNEHIILTHLEKEELLLRAPEEWMFERAGGGGTWLRLSTDHLLDQILSYDVIWFDRDINIVFRLVEHTMFPLQP